MKGANERQWAKGRRGRRPFEDKMKSGSAPRAFCVPSLYRADACAGKSYISGYCVLLANAPCGREGRSAPAPKK